MAVVRRAPKGKYGHTERKKLLWAFSFLFLLYAGKYIERNKKAERNAERNAERHAATQRETHRETYIETHKDHAQKKHSKKRQKKENNAERNAENNAENKRTKKDAETYRKETETHASSLHLADSCFISQSMYVWHGLHVQ